MRRVPVDIGFRHGVGTGDQIGDVNRAVHTGRHLARDAVAGDSEGDAGDNAVLAGLNQAHGADCLHLQNHIGADRVGDILSIGDHVLNPRGARTAVRPGDDARADAVVLGGGNPDVADNRGVRRDGQLIPTSGKADAGSRGAERKVRENAVGIGQCGGVVGSVPLELIGACAPIASGAKAGHPRMVLHAGDHGAVIGLDLAAQRVRRPDIFPYRALSVGRRIHLVERSVPFAYDYFPHQQLGCQGMAEACGVRRILAAPRGGDIPVVPVLHDAPQQNFDGIRRNRDIVAGGIVFPIRFIPSGERVAGILADARLNAVGYLSSIGIQTMYRCAVELCEAPAAHQGYARVTPGRRRIVGVSVPGEVHHIGVHLGCGEHRRAHRQECREAHQQCKKR